MIKFLKQLNVQLILTFIKKQIYAFLVKIFKIDIEFQLPNNIFLRDFTPEILITT